MSDSRMDSEMEEIVKPLIRFWEGCNECWWVKNIKSQFFYANNFVKSFLNIPENFGMEGRYDGELPTAIHKFEAEFQDHDRKVGQLRERLTSLEIHRVGKDNTFRIWYCDKFPIIGEKGDVLGIIAHNRPVDSFSLSRLKGIKTPSLLIFTPPDDLFTPKEWEVIFYTCQLYTPKMIEAAVGIPHRTVEDILGRIYSKSGVKNKRDLIDYCMDHGFNNFIPQSVFQSCESLLNPGVSQSFFR